MSHYIKTVLVSTIIEEVRGMNGNPYSNPYNNTQCWQLPLGLHLGNAYPGYAQQQQSPHAYPPQQQSPYGYLPQQQSPPEYRQQQQSPPADQQQQQRNRSRGSAKAKAKGNQKANGKSQLR